MEFIDKKKEQINQLIAKYFGTAESKRLKKDYLIAKKAYSQCLKKNFMNQYFEGKQQIFLNYVMPNLGIKNNRI